MHRGLLYYLLLMFFVDRLSAYIVYFIPSNHIVLPIYALVEVLFFTWFYNYQLFEKPKVPLLLLGVSGAIYICWELVFDFMISVKSAEDFQPYCKVVDNFVIIVFALIYLHKKMSHYTDARWDNLWLNLSVLIFYTCTLIIFLPFNFLVNAASNVTFYFWMLNVILVIMFYGFAGLLIFKQGRAATAAARQFGAVADKKAGTIKRALNIISLRSNIIFKK